MLGTGKRQAESAALAEATTSMRLLTATEAQKKAESDLAELTAQYAFKDSDAEVAKELRASLESCMDRLTATHAELEAERGVAAEATARGQQLSEALQAAVKAASSATRVAESTKAHAEALKVQLEEHGACLEDALQALDAAELGRKLLEKRLNEYQEKIRRMDHDECAPHQEEAAETVVAATTMVVEPVVVVVVNTEAGTVGDEAAGKSTKVLKPKPKASKPPKREPDEPVEADTGCQGRGRAAVQGKAGGQGRKKAMD